jgi:hypothetical protein
MTARLTDRLASNSEFVEKVRDGAKLGTLKALFSQWGGETTIKEARRRVQFNLQQADECEPDAPVLEAEPAVRQKQPTPAQAHREILQRDMLHPPVDVLPISERERELERQVAALRTQLTWANHANPERLTGGTLTINHSDDHHGDRGHMLDCYAELKEKTLALLDIYKPSKIVMLSNGDKVAGRGVYKEQHMDAVVPESEKQNQVAAWHVIQFDRAVKAAQSQADVQWKFTHGNHDINMGERLTPNLVYLVRGFGVQATYYGDEAILNLADAGCYNAYFEHGTGYSDISPSSPKWWKNMQEKLLRLTRRFYADRRIRRVAHGHCFDEETEILTPLGWKRHSELVEGQSVMTLNREAQTLEWNPIRKVFRYDDFRELLHARGGYGIDLAITEGHGLWVGTPRRNTDNALNWHSETAGSIEGKDAYFLSAGIHDQDASPLTLAQLKVLAWIMAEGSLGSYRKDGTPGCIRIAQSDLPDGRMAELLRDLSEAGLAYTVVKRYSAGTQGHGTIRNYDAYRINIQDAAGEWRRWIGLYLDTEKNPTPALWSMSHEQMCAFWDAYIRADGNPSNVRGFQVSSQRKPQIDLLQSIACRIGLRSSISVAQDKRRPRYVLSACETQTTLVKGDRWERKPYSGTVWCVNVENGTLLVRRGGRTAITLNTHWASLNQERGLDLFVDTTGGCQRNDRVLLGKNNRPLGWIAYISPAGYDDILDPMMIQPSIDTVERELEDPYLYARNMESVAGVLRSYREMEIECGVRPGDGVMPEGR